MDGLFQISDQLQAHSLEPIDTPLCNISFDSFDSNSNKQRYISKKNMIPASTEMLFETGLYSTFIVSFLIFNCILLIFISSVYSFLNQSPVSFIVIGILSIVFLLVTYITHSKYTTSQSNLMSLTTDNCVYNESLKDPFKMNN